MMKVEFLNNRFSVSTFSFYLIFKINAFSERMRNLSSALTIAIFLRQNLTKQMQGQLAFYDVDLLPHISEF